MFSKTSLGGGKGTFFSFITYNIFLFFLKQFFFFFNQYCIQYHELKELQFGLSVCLSSLSIFFCREGKGPFTAVLFSSLCSVLYTFSWKVVLSLPVIAQHRLGNIFLGDFFLKHKLYCKSCDIEGTR